MTLLLDFPRRCVMQVTAVSGLRMNTKFEIGNSMSEPAKIDITPKFTSHHKEALCRPCRL